MDECEYKQREQTTEEGVGGMEVERAMEQEQENGKK